MSRVVYRSILNRTWSFPRRHAIPANFPHRFQSYHCGSQLQSRIWLLAAYPIPSSEGLPPKGSHIYLEWNEPSSNEPPGWYRCSVTSYSTAGLASIMYPDQSTESVNLHSVRWHLSTGNARHYLPADTTPPTPKVPKVHAKMEDQKVCRTAPLRSKAYRDDLTLISTNKSEHQVALGHIDSCCRDLSLSLKPSKCISLAFDGKRSNPNTTFLLSSGQTNNIQKHPTKFLGKVISHCPKTTSQRASDRLRELISPQLRALDECAVGGEYKVWMLNYAVLPSLHFFLMVNDIPKTQIKSVQNQITKMLKKWLHLPPCTTLSTLFHPGSLNLKFLPRYQEEAKLALISAVNRSTDSHVLECLPALDSPSFLRASHIDPATWESFQVAITRCRTETVAPKPNCILSACKSVVSSRYARDWEAHLNTLTVQNALSDILPLGSEDQLWNRLLTGMPAGQLSFVLRASTECLPSPSTLVRWGYSSPLNSLSRKCPLCSYNTCTAHHVLSSCPSALSDGQYTWRHDRVLAKLFQFVRDHNPAATVFADIPSLRACESPPATVPTQVATTTARPDIVLYQDKSVTLLELTVPLELSNQSGQCEIQETEQAIVPAPDVRLIP